MRKYVRVGTAGMLGAILALAGCSASKPVETASPTATASSSAVSSKPFDKFPTVTGEYGKAPTIEFPATDAPKELKTEVLVKGTGAEVKENDTLTVNYHGVLWGGDTPFDSSFARSQPATFGLNDVISGWKQGLAGKRVGDRVLLLIPSDLAYGPQGKGESIPPNSPLVFVVDILSALSHDPAAAVAGAGAPSATPADFPVEVTGALGKQPTIKFRDGANVTAENRFVIADGAGAEIKETSTIWANLTQIEQNQNGVQSTWTSGKPVSALASTNELVKSLVGKKVGTRAVFVFPASGKAGAQAMVVDVINIS